MKIVVDAGHGGPDPGCVSPWNGLKEKDLTLAIAARLTDRLLAAGHVVVRTRSADERIPLSRRCATANAGGVDLAVSVHLNADDSIDEGDLEPRGFEVWCYRKTRLGVEVRSHKVAAIVEESLRALPFPSRGVKTVVDPKTNEVTSARARYWVGPWDAARRIGTVPPAILVECGFLTSPKDSVFFALADAPDGVAQLIATGIARAAAVLPVPTGRIGIVAGSLPFVP